MTTRGAIDFASARAGPRTRPSTDAPPTAAAPARKRLREIADRWACSSKTSSAGTPRSDASACAAWILRSRSVSWDRAMASSLRFELELEDGLDRILLTHLRDLEIVVPAAVR